MQIAQYRIDDESVQPLKDEALILQATADRVASSTCILENDGGVNGRGSLSITGPGPVLQNFHSTHGLRLAETFAANIGQIFPTRSSYLYYAIGDHSFFHHDSIHAHVTIIIPLFGAFEPLLMYPEFGPPSVGDVVSLNEIISTDTDGFKLEMLTRFGRRGNAFPVNYRQGVACVIRGRNVPHARPSQKSATAVATMCYAFVSPSRDWLVPED